MTKASLISIKTSAEIETLAQAGKILTGIIGELKSYLKVGMTTGELDSRAEELIRNAGVLPAFKGYRGFPGCICASVNDEVVHGIPGKRRLNDGDIVSVDVGIIFKGYYSDTAVTLGVGTIQPELQKLLDITKESLYQGIRQARAGNHLSDISHAVQKYVEKNNFSVVRDFVGHGIGSRLHEEPEIPNFGEPKQGPILKEGMVLAIEPMVNLGSWKTKIDPDGWTVRTADGSASAHFEHTIAIINDGPRILTE